MSARLSQLRSAVQSAKPTIPNCARPIVIIGAGGIVQAAHLPAYEKARFPVLALADAQAGKAAAIAREWGIGKGFDSAAEAVRFAPPDCVFDVAVPASQLINVVRELPKRAAILIQKPMGENIHEAEAIRTLCHERDLIAAVNFQLRYAPNHLGALALARAGVLGNLHDIEVQVRTYTPWHLWTFLESVPRLEILYHSIHYLDLVRSWLGTPARIYAKTLKHPSSAHLAATKSMMILDYGDDVRVFIATQHGHNLAVSSQLSFVQWEGTRGAIRMGMGVNLDYPTGKPDTLAYVERTELPSEWCDVPVSGNWFPDAFTGSMSALQAYVEGSANELPTNVDDAFETMALVEAAYRSSQRGGENIAI